jgi:hypothetical protein
VEGLVFCKACPLGSTSSVGAIAINECYCAVGYYGTPGNCRPCPNLGGWGEVRVAFPKSRLHVCQHKADTLFYLSQINKWTYCVETDLQVP